MALEIYATTDGIAVKLSGEIDEYASRELRGELDDIIASVPFNTLTLDMDGVTFVDSTGLGLIFARYKKVKARGARLYLKNVPKQVDRVFSTSGVYRYAPKTN